jgi:hypothetical protein
MAHILLVGQGGKIAAAASYPCLIYSHDSERAHLRSFILPVQPRPTPIMALM